MPNKNYQRGRRLEWQVKKDLEKLHWHVLRTAGSHGAYDLIAIRDAGTTVWVKFIQCKVLAKTSEGKIKALMKELVKTSPLRMPYLDTKVWLQVELIVKVQGTKDYTVIPLEECVNA